MNLIARKGMSIPLVLSVASILLVYLSVVWRSGMEQNRQVRMGVSLVQARLMALSGAQHLLLKARFMPTELYDAWALSCGRNPYFDFSDSAGAGDHNPGPRFITRGSAGADPEIDVVIDAADDFVADPDGWYDDCRFAGGSWPVLNGEPVKNSQLYLWKFCADVTNRDAIQPALAVRSSDGDPYDAIYEVVSLQLMGQRDHRGYLEDTLGVEVRGSASDDRGNIRVQHIRQTVVIRRN